ncbi:MAG: SPOR domain-containing protein [Hydrogenophaga sp.]
MLRWLIVLLVLANAGYFAWTQGQLAALGLVPAEPSEPQRLQAQIRPEALRLLNGPKAAAPNPSAALPAVESPTEEPPAEPAETRATPEPTACWAAGGFTASQEAVLRSALASTGLPAEAWQLSEQQTAGRWVVYMGRYNAEQLERKREELKARGVDFRTLPPPLGPALALGTFSSEASAQQGLQDVGKKGVRTARVVQERPESSVWNLRLPAITDAQRATVAGLGAALAGKRLQACE